MASINGTSRMKRPTGLRAGQTRGDGARDIKVPKGSRGNTLADQEWLQAHFPLDELERIGEDEKGIPFGAQWRWCYTQEYLDELGEFNSIMPSPCTARAYLRDKEGRYVVGADNEALNRPCLRAAIVGTDVCAVHGGYIPQVKASARARISLATDVVVGRLLEIALDPETAHKDAISAMNSLLDRAGIKGGVEIDVTMPQWQQGLRKLFEGEYGHGEAEGSEPGTVGGDSGGASGV